MAGEPQARAAFDGHSGPDQAQKRRSTNSDHDFPRYPNLVLDLEIVHPEQVWVCDITYIRLRYGFVYLAVIMMSSPEVSVDGIWGATWIIL
jgi:hypothetical protein